MEEKLSHLRDPGVTGDAATASAAGWRRVSPKGWGVLLLGVVISLFALLRAGAAWAGPASAMVTFLPSPVSVSGCDTVPVQVWVNDVESLYGVDIEVQFDPAVLEVVDTDPVSDWRPDRAGQFPCSGFPFVPRGRQHDRTHPLYHDPDQPDPPCDREWCPVHH